MAKTMYMIQMDYQNALRQADRLERVAEKIDRLTDSQWQSCMDHIAAGWKSESAASFVNKGNITGGNIKKQAGNLKKTASVIRQIARNAYEAEREAYELVQMRNFRN